MSNKIDNRVVAMQFDNKQFESGIKTSLDSIGNLKKGLNFEGSAKGLSNIGDVSKNFSFSGISDGIDKLQSKFSALSVIGITAIANLANSAVDAGKRIASALTVQPITQGFSEYELKMGSIQTIMASTGEDLGTVNKYLQDLNTYSDKTIYSFADMTSNIGKFTNAGVSLKDSVAAIQGVANVAAVSGANAEEASRAMYNFGQALSSGSVKLMDWKSIELANMGTKEFKQQLIDTGVAMGTLVAVEGGYISTTTNTEGKVSDLITSTKGFNESLQAQWLTTDVLTSTLGDYSSELTDIGKKATAAASDVKTFSMLYDTLKESAGSGWATTWELLVGDFEEAKVLLRDINDLVGGFITSSANARNELLQGWKDLGGRTELIKALGNVFKFVGALVKPIAEAFRSIFPPTTAQQLYDLTHGFLLFSEKLKVSGSTAETIKGIFSSLFSAIKIGVDVISAVVGGITGLIGALLTGGDFGTVISEMFTKLATAFTGGFSNIISNITPFVSGILDLFKGIGSGVSVSTSGIIDTLKSFANAFKSFWLGLTGSEGEGIVSKFTESMNYYGFMIRENVLPALESLGSGFSYVVGKIKDAGIAMFNWIKDSSGLDLSVSFGPLTSGLQGLGDTIKSIGEGVGKIAGPFVGLITSIIEAASKLFDAFGETFDENGAYTLFDLLAGGLMVSIMYNINKLLNIFKSITSAVPGLLEGVTNILDGVRGCLKAYQQDIQSKALMRVAEAVALLAAAILVLSLIDPAKLAIATAAITVLFAELTTALSLTSKFTKTAAPAQLAALGASMVLFAGACLILAGALYVIAQLNVADMVQGLVGLTAVIGLLVGASKALGGKGGADTDMLKTAFSLILFASAVKIMAGAIEQLSKVLEKIGSLDIATITKGFASIAAILGALYLFMQKADFEKLTWERAAGIVLLSAALWLIAESIGKLGDMNTGRLTQGLVVIGILMEAIVLMNKFLGAGAGLEKIGPSLLALGAALLLISISLKIIGDMSMAALFKSVTTFGLILLILVVSLNLMTSTVAGSGAMIAAAAAVLIMAVALNILGAMSWEAIIKGLVAFAAVMGIFIGVSLLLAPIIPIIAGAGGALLLFGLAVLAAGAGVFFLASGIAALVAVGIPGVAVVKSMVVELARLIPTIAIEFGKGIIELMGVIIEGAPKIIEAVLVLVGGVIEGLITLLPKIANLIIELLEQVLRILVTIVPEIAQAGLDILLAVLRKLAENIPKVVELVGDIIVAFLKAFASQTVRIANEILETFINVINGVAESIRRNSTKMVAAIKNLVNSIIETFKKFDSMFKDIGGMIINGIIDGLRLGPLKDAVFNAGESVVGWFKKALHINSPSKDTVNIGENLGEGLILGMKNTSSQVRVAASAMSGIAKSGIIKSLAGVGDGYMTDVDIRPTIRPVVDMTDVEAGIAKTFSGKNTSPTIDVAVSADKAAKATEVNAVYWKTHDQPDPASVPISQGSPTNIVVNNVVRNDQDIRKISQGLKTLLDKTSSKRGVVPAT